MKCNPWRWLWGLIPIAMLAWLTVHLEKDGIEADLTSRSVAALRDAGLNWADARFSGRDGIVTGRADDAKAAERVDDIVEDVWGVRAVDPRTELLDEVKNYTWSARLDDDSVDLHGYAPNEEARRSIIGVVMANFPKLSVKDKLKLARGVSDRDAWLGAVSFALKQLAGLKHGRIDLNGLDLSIKGEAMDLPSYWAIDVSLANELPQHVKLISSKITPPIVKPYVWKARYGKRQLQMTGYLPTDPDREEIYQTAKKLFRKAAVVDRVELGGGAPKGMEGAAMALIETLAELNDGVAEIDKTNISIKGHAPDEKTARALAAQLHTRIPDSFKLSEAIRFPKVEIPTISPYVTEVGVENAGVEVAGYAPSEAARKTLVTLMHTLFPGKPVADRLALGAGAPAQWSPCLTDAVRNLARLDSGRVVLSDRTLRVTGKTVDEKLAVQVPRDVRAGASLECESDAEVRFTGTPPPGAVLTGSGGEAAVPPQSEADALKATAEANAEVEARVRETELAKAEAEAEEKAREEAAAREKAEAEAKAREEVEARAKAEAEEKARREAAASEKAEAEAKAREEAEARAKAEAEEKAREEAAAREKAEAEAKVREEAEARAKAEAEEKARQEAAAREKAEAEAAAREKAEAEHAAEDARREKEKQEAAACQAEIDKLGLPGVIHFARASADLETSSERVLRPLVEVAKDCPAASIRIEGHTDSEGADENNQRLSERRAQAVVDYLTQAGIDAARLSAVGYGASRPVVPNNGRKNMAKNRRIEFKVTAK